MLHSKLEGNKPTDLHILGLVDDAHTTAAELLVNAVARNGLADHWAQNPTSVKQASQRGEESRRPIPTFPF
jgi:hypothetical protein